MSTWLEALAYARSAVTSSTRRGCLLAIGVAATASLGMIAPAGASAATKCGTPPPVSIFFGGTQSEGVIKLGKNAAAMGVGGTISCGVLTLEVTPENTVPFKIPAENVVYNPFTVKLFGFLPLEGTLTVDGPADGGLGPVYGPENPETLEAELIGFSTTFEAPVTSTISLLIFKCSIGPFPVALTTGTSGSLTGKYLTGELVGPEGLSGELVGNNFAVPKIHASSSCPGFLAGLTNFILGLPLKAGQSSVTSEENLKPELEEGDPISPTLGFPPKVKG